MKEYRGIRGLVVAKLTTDNAETLAYGTVKKLAGVARLTRTTENSSEAHYYDNGPAIVIDSVGADTVECECSAFEEDILAEITGQYYDSTLGTLVEGNAEPPYFAVGYITKDTDGNERWVWRHKVKASIPDVEHKSKDNSTDANGQTITFTGVNTEHVFTKTGESATAVVHKAETGLFTETEFFASVQDIDKIQAKADAE